MSRDSVQLHHSGPQTNYLAHVRRNEDGSFRIHDLEEKKIGSGEKNMTSDVTVIQYRLNPSSRLGH